MHIRGLRRRCKHCGRKATWQSRVDSSWLCDSCRPCWCNYCNGRFGVHNADAEALYQAQIEALRAVYGD